jgi:HSP20 family protein
MRESQEDYYVPRETASPEAYVVPEPTPHEEGPAMSVFRFEPFRDPARELDRLMSMAVSGTRGPLGMPLDVYRGEDGSYHVEADLPGVDPDSIEVTVDSGALTIQAERTPSYRESQQVIVAERSQGSFARLLSLGEGVDSQNLTADYADGVLHVTIPASPRSQPRRVEITHATGGSRTISGSTVEQGDASAGSTGDTG